MAAAQLGLFPTVMGTFLDRVYAGKKYSRPSMIFGEKEPLLLTVLLTSPGPPPYGLPVIHVPVKVYLDGKHIATITTDSSGTAYLHFPNGIAKGDHVFKCVFEGTIWNNPAEDTKNFRTVGMQIAYFKSYVENLAAASPATIESSIVDSLLNERIGVVPVRTEADAERVRYIFTMLVPEEDTSGKTAAAALPIWTIVVIIIAAIAAALAAYAIAAYVTIVYVVGYYQCGICGAHFTTCEALREHLIKYHPIEWEKIKDRFECAPPPSPFPAGLEYVFYAIIGIAGAFLLLELIKAIRGK